MIHDKVSVGLFSAYWRPYCFLRMACHGREAATIFFFWSFPFLVLVVGQARFWLSAGG